MERKREKEGKEGEEKKKRKKERKKEMKKERKERYKPPLEACTALTLDEASMGQYTPSPLHPSPPPSSSSFWFSSLLHFVEPLGYCFGQWFQPHLLLSTEKRKDSRPFLCY